MACLEDTHTEWMVGNKYMFTMPHLHILYNQRHPLLLLLPVLNSSVLKQPSSNLSGLLYSLYASDELYIITIPQETMRSLLLDLVCLAYKTLLNGVFSVDDLIIITHSRDFLRTVYLVSVFASPEEVTDKFYTTYTDLVDRNNDKYTHRPGNNNNNI